jgi:hypothetical protein
LLKPVRKKEEDQGIEAPSETIDEPSQSPKKGKKRGRAVGGKASPAQKKLKVEVDKTLSNLAACSQALVFKATALALGSDVVLRIYLVPEDLAELSRLNAKERLSRPSHSIVRSVLQSIRQDPREWNGGLSGAQTLRLMDETDERTLLEIFHGVEVPAQDGFVTLDASSEIRDRIHYAVMEQPEAIKTDLFPFQRVSLLALPSLHHRH